MAAQRALKDSLTQFSSDLYDKVVSKQASKLENAFMSPLSIYAAFTMTMAGADGETLTQMQTALRIPATLLKGQTHETIGSALTKMFKSTAEVELALANRLFLLGAVNVEAEFLKTLSSSYQATIEDLNSLSGLEAKRQHINKWVSDNTKTKIPELVPVGGLKEDTELSIINALYFRGSWEHTFDKMATSKADFHMLDGSKIKVHMMYNKKRYPIFDASDLDAQAIRVPFKGSNWEMLIVLPNAKDGLHALVDHLRKPGKLAALLNEPFEDEEVEFSLPRFKLSESQQLDVKQMLEACGMKSAFEQSANFSKISSEKRLYISAAMHKAILEVDEEGATAAAATGVMASLMCFRPNPIIRCDHPFFLSLIIDSTLPVFVGHMVQPDSA